MTQSFFKIPISAFFFLAAVNATAGAANSSEHSTACQQLFTAQKHNPSSKSLDDLDPTVFRTAFDRVEQQLQSSQFDPGRVRKIMDWGTLGVLGKIYDFVWDPSQQKIVRRENPEEARAVRKKTEALLSRAPSQLSSEFQELVRISVGPYKLTETTVMLTAKLVSWVGLSGFAQAILHRFQRTGMSVVDFVYRDSGLESKDPRTGFTMLDEIIEILKQGRGFSFHLVYDKAVWEKELQILQVRYDEYQKADSDESRQKVIDSVNQRNDPFLPFTGVVTTEFLVPNEKPIELKRYFRNQYEDPLGFAEVLPKDDLQLRRRMLYRVIQNLPAGSELEIHAHTALHKRAYLQLGFHVSGETENPLYPGVKVYILRAKREECLIKNKSLVSD